MNLLAGDIGGTKTVLAIYSSSKIPKQLFSKYYTSSRWDSLELIFDDFIKEVPKHISWPLYGCIAAAGKISTTTSKITNLDWVLNQPNLRQICNI